MSKKTIAKSILYELPWMKLSGTKKNFLEKICNKIINDELVEVVRCKDCVYYHKAHIEYGINVEGKCKYERKPGFSLDKSVFRSEDDFCSRGERKEE